MVKAKYQYLILSLFVVATIISGAQLLRAQEIKLKDLFVFWGKNTDGSEQKDRLVVVVTFNPHKGFKQFSELFDAHRRIRMNLKWKDHAEQPSHTIDFYYSGSEQYAVYIDNQKEPVVGLIEQSSNNGSFMVYLGTRRYPAFGDWQALESWWKQPCRLVNGFLCDTSQQPQNYYERYNSGVAAVEVPLEWLQDRLEETTVTKLYVWAEVHYFEAL